MIKRLKMPREQILTAMRDGDFSDDVLSQSEYVVIIMTQDWCPQWKYMENLIYDIDSEEDVTVFELIYNKSDYFAEFMRFKEVVFKNHQIPYIRYYRNGALVNESNAVNCDAFLQNCLKLTC